MKRKLSLWIFILNTVEFALSQVMAFFMLFIASILFLVYFMVITYAIGKVEIILIWLLVFISCAVDVMTLIRTMIFVRGVRAFKRSNRSVVPNMAQHIIGLITSSLFLAAIVFYLSRSKGGEAVVPFYLSEVIYTYFSAEVGLFAASIILRGRFKSATEKEAQLLNENGGYEQKSCDNGVIAPLSPFEEYPEKSKNGQKNDRFFLPYNGGQSENADGAEENDLF